MNCPSPLPHLGQRGNVIVVELTNQSFRVRVQTHNIAQNLPLWSNNSAISPSRPKYTHLQSSISE